MAKKKASQLEDQSADVKSPTTEASVYAAKGGLIRTYTREIHGDNFEALAEEMAAQHVGSRIEVL